MIDLLLLLAIGSGFRNRATAPAWRDGTGYFAQRMMACRSDECARRAALLFTWLQIVLRSLLWLVIGVGLLVVYPYDPASAAGEGFVTARETTFATGIRDLLPAGLRGFMLVGLMAALASTIDTHLTWGASYWSNDLYLRILNRELLRRQPSTREQVRAARISIVVILANRAPQRRLKNGLRRGRPELAAPGASLGEDPGPTQMRSGDLI